MRSDYKCTYSFKVSDHNVYISDNNIHLRDYTFYGDLRSLLKVTVSIELGTIKILWSLLVTSKGPLKK